MAGIRTDHVPILETLVARELGGAIYAIQDLTSGYSGFVYAVTTADARQSPLVIKLTPPERDRPVAEETLDERVSAVRASHFSHAYHLLQQTGLPLPTVFAAGQPGEDLPYFYQLMSFLPGISVATFLESHKHDAPPDLHYLVGHTLGHLHRTTRPYDGWIDQSRPYDLPWTDAFFTSCDSKLATAQQVSGALVEHDTVIRRFLLRQRQAWHPPQRYVLSEFTGFQGMAAFVNNQWHLTGLIDIEDHRFVDPRYVLAGHELALTLGGGVLPDTFWIGYTEQTTLDPSYANVKAVIQLYYLLSWLPVIASSAWRGEPAQQSGVIRYFEQTIYERCTT